jgi:Flp pilus assembly protein TadG
MRTMSRTWRRARLSAAGLLNDCRAVAATEFAVIVPMMMIMFFGVVEISNGVAVDRKVTLVARTLTDLTAQVCPDGSACNPIPPKNQNTGTILDGDLLNAFNASAAILQPYSATPTNARISEIYIDSSRVAKITWSKAATYDSNGVATLVNSSRNPGDTVTGLLPSTILLATQTYVILSEVGYVYTPVVGYVMTGSVTLNDVAYTRPRQVQCVVYTSLPAVVAPNPCPTP